MATRLNTIALDLGTTSIKAAVYTDNCQLEKIFSQPAPAISVNNKQYTSDATAYRQIVENLLEKCQQYCNPTPKLGICYQRSSFLIWDSSNGDPVTALISWQDNRGQSSCEQLQGQQAIIKQLTGLPLTAYYLAPKLHNLLQQKPHLLKGLIKKELLVGTLDSFLIWHWSKGKYFITDASMAARTLLMDIHTGQWSEPLTQLFNIPLQVLAAIHCSSDLKLPLINETILQASVADQSAALLASVATDDSEVLINLGTGGFVIRYQAETSDYANKNYLHTLIYRNADKQSHMAIEGTLNSITAALQPYPFRECKIEHLAEIDDIYCIAEPSGLGAPFFRSDIGLEFSRPTDHLSKQQLASLLLEAIIFRVALILEDFNQQATIHKVFLSGGLSALPCLQQGIALLSPAATYKIKQTHSGLLGTAILTSNLPPATHRQSESIPINNSCQRLIKKYQRWKIWFAQLVSD